MTRPPLSPSHEHRSLGPRAVLATAALAAAFPAALVAVEHPAGAALVALAGLAVTRLVRIVADRLRGHTRLRVAGLDVELAVRRVR